MYVWPNYKTKEELEAAVKAGKTVTVFNSNPLSSGQQNGSAAIEGPHPEAHRWFAQITLKNGKITKVQ